MNAAHRSNDLPDRLSSAEYGMLVEQAPLMIWRADRSKMCDYFNRVWLDFTGRTLEEESGEGWAQGVHPDDLERCLEIYVASFELRIPFEMEYRLRRFDGVYRWIFDRGVPFVNDDGMFAGYIGSCVDVTERVVAQNALCEATEKELAAVRGLLSICSDLASRPAMQPEGLRVQ
jgi:PAS domain S-box-containing protein